MDKTITTTLMIVVSMILVVALFNIAYPAIVQGGEAVTSMSYNLSDQMKNGIAIIHASAELPVSASLADGQFKVYAWVKNTGSERIVGMDRIDVFFGPDGNFVRIPSQDEALGSFPYWSLDYLNGGDWSPAGTVQITIHNSSVLAAGRYYMKVSLPNGISTDYFLGI